MKPRLVALGASLLALTVVTACSAETNSESESTTAPTSSSDETVSGEDTNFDFDLSLDPDSLEKIRNSFNESDREIKDKGGVSFDLVDANANITTSFDIGYDGSGYQNSVIEENEPEEFYWSSDTLYTPVEFLDSEVKEYVLKVNDEAEWFSEPKNTQFSLITPTRIAEAFLAYAKEASCIETDCVVIATGINYLPGLGGFDPPQDEIRMNLTLNKTTGQLENIVLFPGNEALERIITNIEYTAPDIAYPEVNGTVTFDEVTEQILIDNPIEETENSNTSPSIPEENTEETGSPNE